MSGSYIVYKAFLDLDAETTILVAEIAKGPAAWDREVLYSQTYSCIATSNWVINFGVIYIFLAVFRLFRGFAAQPRLGLVTSTISNAASDIFHFLIVFSCVFCTYATAGLLLFGSHVRDFESFLRSLIACWRLVTGDFDFSDTYRGIDWTASFLFLGSFTIFVVLILLNMLLAIVLETYLDVKQKNTEKAETLYSQALETLGR